MDKLPIQRDGFDKTGNPIDFIDIEDGYTWIYQGYQNGIHRWTGIPRNNN